MAAALTVAQLQFIVQTSRSLGQVAATVQGDPKRRTVAQLSKLTHGLGLIHDAAAQALRRETEAEHGQ